MSQDNNNAARGLLEAMQELLAQHAIRLRLEDDCHLPGWAVAQLEQAIAAWNRRPAPEPAAPRDGGGLSDEELGRIAFAAHSEVSAEATDVTWRFMPARERDRFARVARAVAEAARLDRKEDR